MTKELTTLPDFLVPLVTATDVTWSIATFGAIAEYSRAPDETGHITWETAEAKIVTPNGALRFRILPSAKFIAYEGLSKDPTLWSQGISICLPEQVARMSGASTLTEVGHDADAVHYGDRGHLMFNIGVSAPHVDAYVRTINEDLISVLRGHIGRPLFSGDGSALEAILTQNPDRVFVSGLGRIEVKTPIAYPEGKTMTGPHTHVLPNVLAHGRTHAANVPIPDGYHPCLNIFPANPARDDRGEPRTFDTRDHSAFQGILTAHGDPSANTMKQRVEAAVTAGRGPGSVTPPESRTERTALRVALRQLGHILGPGPILDDWLKVYEPND
jgi:hypothetical protein